MDVYVVLSYLPAEAPPPLQRMPTVYAMARRWRGERYHRNCNAMAGAAGQFSRRLSAWYNANDYFSNVTTMQLISRYLMSLEEIVNMPKKSAIPAFNRENNWKGFLEYRLSDLELIDADETVVSDEELLETYIGLVLDGYKITGTYKAATKTATATLQAGERQGDLAGWALSAAGSDPREALKLLFYKHFEALKGDWKPLLNADKPIRRG